MPATNLHGITRTLLVPLACRAIESLREDAILHDPRAVEVFHALGGSHEFLMGMGKDDQFFAALRTRKFDSLARSFLSRNPGGLIVDIGCGLDTRFHRIDNGQLDWIGLDLPEVIHLRRQWLPDADRCKTIAHSMLDLQWLDEVAQMHRPTIFLAEGVFPYFCSADVRPMLEELSKRLPQGELVFDAMSPSMSWYHNHSSSVLKRSGTLVRWDIKNPEELEAWGLCLLERWSYFEKPETRMGWSNLIRYFPPLARATYIVHYRLSQAVSLTRFNAEEAAICAASP